MDYYMEDSDDNEEFIHSMYNEMYNEMFGSHKSRLMRLCCAGEVTLESINKLKDDIGKTDDFKTTALMFYCLYDGKSSEIIDALSNEIGMQDTEGYTALMDFMTGEHNTINIDCILALRDEIGMKNQYNEYALDMFCANVYKDIDKDIANQIINILRDEYKPNRYYNGVDVESIIN